MSAALKCAALMPLKSPCGEIRRGFNLLYLRHICGSIQNFNALLCANSEYEYAEYNLKKRNNQIAAYLCGKNCVRAWLKTSIVRLRSVFIVPA